MVNLMALLTCQDLPTLNDIVDDICVPPAYEDKDLEELRESIQLVVQDFVESNVSEYKYDDFATRIFEYTYGIMLILHDAVFELFKDIDLADMVNEGIYVHLNLFGIPRSCVNGDLVQHPLSEREIGARLQVLRSKDQPESSTPAWYIFRHNKLTASSIWKALDTEASRNQLIYSKCKPLDMTRHTKINIESPLHHGHKYEPISKLIYESEYGSVIEDFGCLADDDLDFIAVTPDGINIRRGSPRYGRLIEIKNPTTRVITGVPKKAYWVQMQLQMHVTKLHLCDFYETAFKEYDNEEAFLNDGSFSRTKKNKRKGIIVCFHNRQGPVYVSCPLDSDLATYHAWFDDLVAGADQMTWVVNTYWWLEQSSCVTVPYNRAWFEAACPKFKDTWDTIVQERQTGYDHRKPSRKNTGRKKKQCKTAVIKVRTQSFDAAKLSHNNN